MLSVKQSSNVFALPKWPLMLTLLHRRKSSNSRGPQKQPQATKGMAGGGWKVALLGSPSQNKQVLGYYARACARYHTVTPSLQMRGEPACWIVGFLGVGRSGSIRVAGWMSM